jgi:hypothetical protein
MTTGSDASLPDPFATHDQTTERIREELRSIIREAESNTSQITRSTCGNKVRNHNDSGRYAMPLRSITSSGTWIKP